MSDTHTVKRILLNRKLEGYIRLQTTKNIIIYVTKHELQISCLGDGMQIKGTFIPNPNPKRQREDLRNLKFRMPGIIILNDERTLKQMLENQWNFLERKESLRLALENFNVLLPLLSYADNGTINTIASTCDSVAFNDYMEELSKMTTPEKIAIETAFQILCKLIERNCATDAELNLLSVYGDHGMSRDEACRLACSEISSQTGIAAKIQSEGPSWLWKVPLVPNDNEKPSGFTKTKHLRVQTNEALQTVHIQANEQDLQLWEDAKFLYETLDKADKSRKDDEYLLVKASPLQVSLQRIYDWTLHGESRSIIQYLNIKNNCIGHENFKMEIVNMSNELQIQHSASKKASKCIHAMCEKLINDSASKIVVNDADLNDTQKNVLCDMLKNRIGVLNAGAGKGKTRLLGSLLKSLKSSGINTIVLASQNKHLGRLREESQDIKCMTLHQYKNQIKHMQNANSIQEFFKGDNAKFKGLNLSFAESESILEESKQSYLGASQLYNIVMNSAIIVEEAATCDTVLLSCITQATPECVYLIGHDQQLSPIGRGEPFIDIFNMLPMHMKYTLSQNMRSQQDIVTQAEGVLDAKTPVESEGITLNITNEQGDEFVSALISDSNSVGIVGNNRANSADCLGIRQLYEKYYERMGRKKLTAASPFLKGKRDADRMHETWNKFEIVVGDEIVVDGTTPANDLFYNGMTAKIKSIDWKFDGEGDSPHIVIGDICSAAKEATYAITTWAEMKLVAPSKIITCNKSQGSEYHSVKVLMPFSREYPANKKWLYVSMTRAKKCVELYYRKPSDIQQILTRPIVPRKTFLKLTSFE